MHIAEIYLVVGETQDHRLPVGTTLDTISDVVDVARDYVNGPLREVYPALYPFTEFGLQAIESFSVAVSGAAAYTARIGDADLSDIPLLDREVAGNLAAHFVTALRVHTGQGEERALRLLTTEFGDNWERATFTVEPGKWLTRHLLGEMPISLPLTALKA